MNAWLRSLSLPVLLTPLVFSGGAHATPAGGGLDVIETAQAAGRFRTLLTALEAANLKQSLQGPGPFTVFAPTDTAFAKLPPGTLDELLKSENIDKLTNVLTYHVVPGNLSSADVVGADYLLALNGQRLDVEVTSQGVFIDGAQIFLTDVQCSNGVIHILDDVMLPELRDVVEVATQTPGFTILSAALTTAGLVDDLQTAGPFTIFAPTDAAFANLPPGTVERLLLPQNRDELIAVLTYHVVPAKVYRDQVKSGKVPTLQGENLQVRAAHGKMWVNQAQVGLVDIEASNGIIHVIDAVLLPY